MAFTITTSTTATSSVPVTVLTATTAKVKIQGRTNRDTAGLNLYVKYTKGSETTATLSYAILADDINTLTTSTTDVYKIPTSVASTLTQAASVLSGSGNWIIPISTPVCTKCWLHITVSFSGSSNDTTAILINAQRDTTDGD
jgi:hypothetical protein